jgi:hypothetical protein
MKTHIEGGSVKAPKDDLRMDATCAWQGRAFRYLAWQGRAFRYLASLLQIDF